MLAHTFIRRFVAQCALHASLQAEHKIQSANGPLTLTLAKVGKAANDGDGHQEEQPTVHMGPRPCPFPPARLVLLLQVPKMLGSLRSSWCPDAMLVSFKLETDEQILLRKVGPARFCPRMGLHLRLAPVNRRGAGSCGHVVGAQTLSGCRTTSRSTPCQCCAAGLQCGGKLRRAPRGGQRAALSQGPPLAGRPGCRSSGAWHTCRGACCSNFCLVSHRPWPCPPCRARKCQ